MAGPAEWTAAQKYATPFADAEPELLSEVLRNHVCVPYRTGTGTIVCASRAQLDDVDSEWSAQSLVGGISSDSARFYRWLEILMRHDFPNWIARYFSWLVTWHPRVAVRICALPRWVIGISSAHTLSYSHVEPSLLATWLSAFYHDEHADFRRNMILTLIRETPPELLGLLNSAGEGLLHHAYSSACQGDLSPHVRTQETQRHMLPIINALLDRVPIDGGLASPGISLISSGVTLTVPFVAKPRHLELVRRTRTYLIGFPRSLAMALGDDFPTVLLPLVRQYVLPDYIRIRGLRSTVTVAAALPLPRFFNRNPIVLSPPTLP